MRRLCLGLLYWLFGDRCCMPAIAGTAAEWADVVAKARGQTVYFNAWGGGEQINAYIAWAAEQLDARLRHQARACEAGRHRRRRCARAGGEDRGQERAAARVDLIWINGENFAAMKSAGLLFGPFAESLPNYRYVDIKGKPTVRIDFTVPVDGLESPWGMAQIVFIHDTARLKEPPRSMAALLGLGDRPIPAASPIRRRRISSAALS